MSPELSLELSPTHNQPEYSVSELANALKRTVEDTFGYVRVRGEISGCKQAGSGHLYLDLKDTNALINAVCWKGVLSKLDITPENGMEVICTGRMSTYAGRSSYQLVVERMEMAGAGALMALLEKRKAQLASEGLFENNRKLPLPYLPRVIGVITSPTGAVIRDILHRIADRFPVHVLIWGVPVQGKGAESHVAEAIEGFNRFDGITTPPRPDLLIVARGGGSMEDLWTFNEEMVVRATASSTIPLISAIGHETDTTLIDYASSIRAPTPTAAAEMAVPVLSDLRDTLVSLAQRINRAVTRQHHDLSHRIEGLARGLINPEKMLETRIQRADEWGERLERVMLQRLRLRADRLESLTQRLSPASLVQKLTAKEERLALGAQRLNYALQFVLNVREQRYEGVAQRLRTDIIAARIILYHERIHERVARLHHAWGNGLERRTLQLENAGRMLEVLSHQHALKRGFAYVTASDGTLISSVKQTRSGVSMHVHFYDGQVVVSTVSSLIPPKKKAAQPTLPEPPKQHQLF